jgi:hypothetical protein
MSRVTRRITTFLTVIGRAESPRESIKVDRSRVVIYDGKIFVVIDSPEGPQLVFREGVLDFVKNEDTGSYHALTESGKIMAFTKDTNCGCGSRIRSWSPFGNYLSATGDADA